MKKYLILFIFILACDQTEYVEPLPQLEITVVDHLTEEVIQSARVRIYETFTDWEHRVHAVDSMDTSSQGVVLFTDLQEIKYYFFIEKGEMDNVAHYSATHEPLKVGVRSQLVVKLMEHQISFKEHKDE